MSKGNCCVSRENSCVIPIFLRKRIRISSVEIERPQGLVVHPESNGQKTLEPSVHSLR